MKNTLMKCRYNHCKHGGEVDVNEAVKVGKAYYHKDCLKEKQEIEEVMKVYEEKVDPHPIYNRLRKVINTIVYDYENGSDFLLFALKRYLAQGKRLNHPEGLYYVVKDYSAKEAWARLMEAKRNEITMVTIDVDDNLTELPKIETQRRRGFADILR